MSVIYMRHMQSDILLSSDHEYAVRIASSPFSLQEIIENPETLHFSEDFFFFFLLNMARDPPLRTGSNKPGNRKIENFLTNKSL